jgi:hypothetical protein
MRFSALHFGGRASPFIACMGQQRILKLARGQPNDCQGSAEPTHQYNVGSLFTSCHADS